MRHTLLLALTLSLFALPAQAQVSISQLDTEVAETFDDFRGAGFAPSPAADQLSSNAFAVFGLSDGDLSYGGTQTSGDFARGDSGGGVRTGGIYAFETATDDYALGFQPGRDDLTPGAIFMCFENQTGSDIGALDVNYDVQYYNDQARSNDLALFYAVSNRCETTDPGSVTAPFTDASLRVAVPQAEDTSPQWEEVPQGTTLNGLAAADGAYITLAFVTDDVSGSGARPELALDNIRVTARAAGAAVLTVDDDGGADYTSIQAAIDAAAAGDVIEVANGTYGESLDITTPNLTITGESESGVVINTRSSGYGVFIAADGVTLENMTINGPTADAPDSYGIKAQGESTLPSENRMDGLTLRELTVQGSDKTEIDLNGVDNAMLESLTADGQNTGGVGLALTDSDDATISGLTTRNNNWGGAAIFVKGEFFSLGSDGVAFTGSNTFEEQNAVYLQASSSPNSATLADITNFTPPNEITHAYTVLGAESQYLGAATNQSDALDYAANVLTGSGDPYVGEIATGNLVVGPGLSIQAAIDGSAAASAFFGTTIGTTVTVLPGTYGESVTVNQSLTLSGPNAGTPGDDSTNRGAEATIEGQVIIEASGATFDGFTVVAPPASTTSEAEALRISNTPDNVIVRNNIVKDFEDANDATNRFDITGINAFGGDASDPIENVQITDNKVVRLKRELAGGGAAGISIQGNVSGATVTGNVVEEVGLEKSAYGFGIVVRGTNNHGEEPSGVEVSGNEISTVRSDPSSIYAGVGFGVEAGTVALEDVTGNTLRDTDLQAEDKTLGFDLIGFIGENSLDGAVIIGDGSGGVKDETNPNEAQRIYSAISLPVSRAVAGETVRVFSGTYEESVTIDKALTLRGASAGGSTSSSLTMASKSTSPSCTAGAVIDASGGAIGLTVSADDVTLEDLCVTSADNHNIYTNASISNLTLTGVEALNAGEHGMEIDENADITTLTINGSNFSGNINNIGSGTGKGLNIRGTVDGLTIDGSAFDHNNYGFYTTLGGNVEQELADGGSTNVSDVTITNTTFNDNPNKGIYAEKLDNATFENIEVINSGTDVNAPFFPQAIDINLKLRDYGNITVRNATVRGSIGEGLNVKARNGFYGGPYESPDDASLSSLTVENSTFEDNRWGVVVGYGVENATITGNLVNNNGNAVDTYQDKSYLNFNRGGVLFYATPDAATFKVNGNCITENGLTERNGFTGYGLSTTDTPVDATNNWWGSAAGPGTGGANSAEGTATVDPFAIDPVSGVEGCGGATDTCPASTFDEELVSNTPPGKVRATITDSEGIEQVRFYEVSNFTIASEDGEFADPDNDGIWTPSGSSPLPTSTSFMLTQADTDNPDASYFAQITNDCGTVTDIDPVYTLDVTPAAFALESNYPNPFRTQTTIGFALPEATDVTLSVYDVMGRKVATLVDRDLPSGTHEVVWQGRDRSGQALASGVYFVRLQAGERTATQRLTIVR